MRALTFTVAAALIIATGCKKEEDTDTEDTDTDTDTDTDSDTDTDTDTDTGEPGNVMNSGYRGEATVDATANTYAGTETFYLEGTASTPAPVLCHWTWQAAPSATPITAECTGCAFAFNVALTGGAQTGGDCATLLGGELPAADGGEYGYGWHPAYDAGDGSGPQSTMMYYIADDAKWVGIGAGAWDEGTKTFSYDFPGYQYYY